MNEKCCEDDRRKKTQNYEFSDSLVFPSPSEGRQEDRVQSRPVPRRIGTAEVLSKNFRQGYYQLGLSCHLLMNPLQSHSQDYHQAHPQRQDSGKEAI